MSEPKGIKKPFDKTVAINGASTVAIKSVTNSTGTIFVTRAVLSITTHAAGTDILRDTTPTTFMAHTDAAAGAGIPSVVEWEFGVNGLELSQGKNLELVGVAAQTGFVFVEGYEVYVA